MSVARALRAPREVPADVRWLNATASVVGVLALLVVLAVAVLWIARQPAFAIRSIAVDGDLARNSVATIRANAAPRLAGSFLTLELAAVQRAFESVPWVRRAVVRRIWPNRLAVRLEEHRPAAYWGGDGGAEKLVNSFGEVFEANQGDVDDADDAPLPTLHGPDGSSAQVLAMHGRVAAALAPLGKRVAGLGLSQRGSWRAVLADGAAIELGRGNDDEVIARAERFVATLPELTNRFQRPLAHADLRHHDGYAVRLKGVATLAASAPAPARR